MTCNNLAFNLSRFDIASAIKLITAYKVNLHFFKGRQYTSDNRLCRHGWWDVKNTLFKKIINRH